MKAIHIRQGRNIPLKGAADLTLRAVPLPKKLAIPLYEFRPQQFRPIVKEGDPVLVGTPILESKDDPRIVITSSASGKVTAVHRGEKRALLSVDIDTDGRQDAVVHKMFSPSDISKLDRAVVIDHLLKGGCWPFLRQRPFSKMANPKDQPKSLFIHAMNTEPLAASIDLILKGHEAEFQLGLDILSKLAPKTYLCFDAKTASKVLTNAKNVESIAFSGAHPAGNVGTHIHHVDQVEKGQVVWVIEAIDVIRVARLFLKGSFDPFKVVALTGESLDKRYHAQTIIGVPVAALVGSKKDGIRYIAGSVLAGQDIGFDGSFGLFASQLTAIPAGGARKFLGWLGMRFEEYTFTRTIGGGFIPRTQVSLDTDLNGGHRAIVLNDVYDDLVALDVMTYFLIKAIAANEIEEMIHLGILECAAEDFALATFACPSKFDVAAYIQTGLDAVEKEA